MDRKFKETDAVLFVARPVVVRPRRESVAGCGTAWRAVDVQIEVAGIHAKCAVPSLSSNHA